ncbi:MAG: DMT family transporter [Anaerolineae bacterium]|nr:DMT family transporter [Anaerolineae bacterium]MBT4309276.1 DMT family transporter [Anaerolineae bacterium]MBT4458493.1 DMT family transporter [Anaerolineae bacterium]MBT6062742.1 DMT family transporter [Anaerolineae bacterium]MBT6322400.1 DMT family transporter [Anaerolineae bacterium]
MSAIFVRWADAPGPITAFYRVTISLFLLTPFFLNRANKNGGIKKSALSIPIWGGILTALDFAFWNTSLSYTTAANATLLGNTAPLWVALGAWFIFRERLNKTFWVGLAIALSGATLIVGFDFLTELELGIGDLLAIISGIFYGAYFLISQRGREHFDSLSYVWLVSFSASIGLSIINIGMGHSFVGYSRETWLFFFASAIISQTIGYIAVSYALGHLPASVVSPSMIGQPVMTTLFAIPLLGEIPNTVQLLGGSIALVGIYLINRAYHNREKNLSTKELID